MQITLPSLKNCVSVFALCLAASACTAANRTKVSVDYYQIQGNTTKALDREIRTKGPKIGKDTHAVAVARIKMTPNVDYEVSSTRCRVSKAKVNVNARVTLPQWKNRANATRELTRAWDNVERYARLHEAVHVSIAFKYAGLMEKAMLAQSDEPDCLTMRYKTSKLFKKLLAEHDREQKQFDADEQKRIAKNVKRKRGA